MYGVDICHGVLLTLTKKAPHKYQTLEYNILLGLLYLCLNIRRTITLAPVLLKRFIVDLMIDSIRM